MSENPDQSNLLNKPKFSIQEIVSTNNTIDNALTLLSNVNFEIVDLLLENTPENLKQEISYKVLSKVKEFNNNMQEIFLSAKNETV